MDTWHGKGYERKQENSLQQPHYGIPARNAQRSLSPHSLGHVHHRPTLKDSPQRQDL